MGPRSISCFGLATKGKLKNPTVSCRGLNSSFTRLAVQLLMGVLFAGLISVASIAQTGNGTISGSVTDPAQRALQGARIEVVGKGLTAVSDAQGQFTITSVPVGNCSVKVSYMGFSDLSTDVTVTAGVAAQVNTMM